MQLIITESIYLDSIYNSTNIEFMENVYYFKTSAKIGR
jgi:hypothetical protein